MKKEAAAQVEVDHWVYERASAEAKLLDAEAQVVIAKLNLGYTEVRAPFEGQMGKALIDPGNVVGSSGQQTALAEIMQLDPIYVVANLNEQDILKIRANLNQQRLNLAQFVKVPIEVALQDESNFSRRGTLEYVSPGIDPATGTMLVRGILANPHRDLLPGFFVRLRLPMERGPRNALLVPDRALQTDQGGRYLLVVNADNVVEKRYVQARRDVRRAARDHLGADRRRPRHCRRVVADEPGRQGRAAADRDHGAGNIAMISKFFIEHPVLANVLAIVLVLIGAICLFRLPIAQYPNIVPPTVQVDNPLSRGERPDGRSIRWRCRSSCRSTAFPACSTCSRPAPTTAPTR